MIIPMLVGARAAHALFDFGERAKVVIFSVTDGEDKLLKYPHTFGAAQVLKVGQVEPRSGDSASLDSLAGEIGANDGVPD